MKTIIFYLILIFSSLFFASCNSLKESSKYNFQSSKYYTSIIPGPDNKVYIEVQEDSVNVFAINRINGVEAISEKPMEIFTAEAALTDMNYTFYNPSLDVDLLTVPLKYRFKAQDVPNQLTTTFNGNLYLGFRNDVFKIRYNQTPLNKIERKIHHFGFSIGAFAGLSSEPVNPWVTSNIVEIEYDGAAFTTGGAFIMGMNNITVGFSVGFDYLLDDNHKHWIYQGKPWIGLAFGINLN